MNKLEQLEQEAFENAVKVHNYYLGEENLKGIYIDGNIAINTSVDNGAEKACVLAEELGHYYTTVGEEHLREITWISPTTYFILRILDLSRFQSSRS